MSSENSQHVHLLAQIDVRVTDPVAVHAAGLKGPSGVVAEAVGAPPNHDLQTAVGYVVGELINQALIKQGDASGVAPLLLSVQVRRPDEEGNLSAFTYPATTARPEA